MKTEITPNKILVIRPDAIGDLILTLPAIQAVKDKFPNAEITLLGNSYTTPLVENHPAIDKIIYDYDLRKYGFDLSINFYNQFKDTWATCKARIPYRIGDASRLTTSWMNNIRVFRHWNDLTLHEIEHNFELLKPLDISTELNKPIIKIDSSAKTFVTNLKTQHAIANNDILIGLHLSTGKGNKGWLANNFIDLINLIKAKLTCHIIITGSSADLSLSKTIEAGLKSPIINLAGKTSLPELAAVISSLSIYVGSDTGPTHLAAALDIPTIAMFSTKFVKPCQWGPWQTRNIIIRPKTTCRLRCQPQKCHYNLCGEEIKPEMVYAAIEALLNNKYSDSREYWLNKSLSSLLICDKNNQIISFFEKLDLNFIIQTEIPSLNRLIRLFIENDVNLLWIRNNEKSFKVKLARFLATPFMAHPPLITYDNRTITTEDTLIQLIVELFKKRDKL